MPTLSLSRPDFASDFWAEIPLEHRTHIRAVLDAIECGPVGKITVWFKAKAAEIGDISPGSFRAKYYALRNGGDWKLLIDGRKVNVADMAKARTAQRCFVAELLTLVEDNQRKNTPAFRRLREIWRTREKPIPGYEDWPGWPKCPEGWSDRNLADIVKKELTKAQARAVRVGTSSKTNSFLPHVLTTRVGLWQGAVIQMDDMWHDNWVTVARGNRPHYARVLELGAVDLFSGHRFHYGFKPRLRRDDGTMENIGGKDGRLFLAGLLHRFGRCPRGMSFMVEHQTMAISDDVERLMYDYSGGAMRVNRQPIEGKQAALLGYWNGTEGGNFRAKALIESLGNRIHNDLARLPMQTGSPSSGLLGPVSTDRMRDWMTKAILKIAEINPKRLEGFRTGTLDFHSQFVPFVSEYYEWGLSKRTDHEMEGWDELEHFVTEYTMMPGSDHWLSVEELMSSAFDPESRAMILRAAQGNPAKWTQRRRMSPLEVWNRREQWAPVKPSLICEIITRDLARECTAKHSYITFRDKEIAPFPLIYEARYISGPRRGERIPHGEKVMLFANPYDDRFALVVDARGCFQGELPLYKRVQTIDPKAFDTEAPFEFRPEMISQELKDAAARKHHLIAEELEPSRIRHAEQVQEARNLRADANSRRDAKVPFTIEEREAAHAKRDTPAHRAANSRNRKRVMKRAAEIETNEVLDAWANAPAEAPQKDPAPPSEPESFNPFA